MSYYRRPGVRTYEPRFETSWQSPKVRGISWKKVKQTGFIKMTPYSKGRTVVERFLARIPTYNFNSHWFINYERDDTPHPAFPAWVASCELEQGDIRYWAETRPRRVVKYVDNLPMEADLHDADQDVMARVVTDNMSSYDLLTELAELRSTLETVKAALVAAIHPLREAARLRDEYLRRARNRPERAAREWANRWLQYRYELMPLILSVQDIISTYADRDAIYKTSRASRHLHGKTVPQESADPNAELSFLRTAEYTYKIRGVGKALFRPSDLLNLRLFDQISFNPVTTAWELIPLSFVIDWFINIGDWLVCQMANLKSLASQREFCISHKFTRTIDTYLVNQRRYEFLITNRYGGSVTVRLPSGPRAQLVQRESADGYDRRLFDPGEVELDIQFDINWMRSLDAFALSLKPLITALRKLL
uniref:A2 maturation protein n=1 Tax=Ellsworth virus TaxID=2707217 RepID=A0A6H0DIB7_9VIRU|nr:MAG: A2 maturation protein [Ellsworth virus]